MLIDLSVRTLGNSLNWKGGLWEGGESSSVLSEKFSGKRDAMFGGTGVTVSGEGHGSMTC